MSGHYRLHVGPYVRCENPKMSKTEKRRACPRAECSRYKVEVSSAKTMFCLACGTAIGSVEIKEKRPSVDTMEILEKIHEKLYTVGDEEDRPFDIWVANSTRTRDYESFMGEDEISEGTQTKEIKAFEDRYAKELAVLGRHYGAANMKIKWGVCGDYG